MFQVSREQDDQCMKSVEITGAPEDVENAKRRIEDCLSGSKWSNFLFQVHIQNPLQNAKWIDSLMLNKK